MGRLAPLARLAAVALVAQACSLRTFAESGAPSAGLPEASSSPVPTAGAAVEPTAAPSVGPPQPEVNVTVEDVGLPEGVDHMLSGMWDERGWIVVGEACRGGGEPLACYPNEAAIWTSVDGRTWERAELAHADSGWMSAVTRWGDAYYAVSHRRGIEAVFWRSTDTRRWEEVGSINIGEPSDEDGSPVVEHLAGGPGGLVATLSDLTDVPSRVIRSTDGSKWSAVDPNAFGYPDDFHLFAADLVATESGVMVVARCGRGYCSTGVWRTRDGIIWTGRGLGDIARGDSTTVVLGDRLVIGQSRCSGESETCEIYVLAANQDGTFRKVVVAPDVIRPELAWTGDAYVLVGAGDPYEFDPPGQVWVSRDGLAWEVARIDVGSCPIPDLIGGPSVALLLGDARCGGSYLLTPS